MSLAEFPIVEHSFYKSLTVIKASIYTDRGYIASQSRHLGLLQRANLSTRIQDYHPDPRNIMKAGSDCTACVSGGRCKHRQGVIRLIQQSQHSPHESGTKILEGIGGSMEKFKDIDSGRKTYKRTIEIISPPDHGFQIFWRNILPEK